jgi:hypothetical protein
MVWGITLPKAMSGARVSVDRSRILDLFLAEMLTIAASSVYWWILFGNNSPELSNFEMN